MFVPNRMALLWFVGSMFYIFHEKYDMSKTINEQNVIFFKKK